MRVAVIRTEPVTERQWELLYRELSDERRDKADRIRPLDRRRESIAAGALLEYLLRQEGVPEPFTYRLSSRGKPSLARNSFSSGLQGPFSPGICFSISHTVGLAVAAVGAAPVGVDVERIRPYPEKVAQKYFSREERRTLIPGDDAAFYRIWTRKEALAKLMDQPLMEILKGAMGEDGHIRWHMHQMEEWVIALCTEEAEVYGAGTDGGNPETEFGSEILTAEELLRETD